MWVPPTGALAARCAETPGGLGNLSGDSESSLNPNQTLTAADSGLAAARAANEQTRERIEQARDGNASGNQVHVGPFSLLVNANVASAQRDRSAGSDSERGYDSDSWGGQLGFDYRLNPHAVVGVLVDWQSSSLEFDRELAGVNFVPQSDAGSNDAVPLRCHGIWRARDLGALVSAIQRRVPERGIQRLCVAPCSRNPVARSRRPTWSRTPTSTAPIRSRDCSGDICTTRARGSSVRTLDFSTRVATSMGTANRT